MARIFTGASGLNTVDNPVRLGFDPKTGISDLQSAVNVNNEANGRVSRRQGFKLLIAGNFHSLFCSGTDCFIGRETAIYQVLPELTLRGVRSSLSGDKISFWTHGDKTFYGNGTQSGQIIESVSSAISTGTNLSPDKTTEFSGPSTTIKLICFHRGRFYYVDSAEPNKIYGSEPFQVGVYNKARNHWKFDSRIIMWMPVEGGIFISTERYIYFFRTGGDRPTLERKTDYPSFEGSQSHDYAEGLRVGGQSPGLCAFWRGSTGACIGFPDGSMVNMTEKKVAHPIDCRTGSGASLLMGPYLIHTVNESLTLCTNIEAGVLTEKATTQYTNHAFNSYCRFGNHYLAANSNGLWEIGGPADAGTAIDAYFSPVLSDFGEDYSKKLTHIHYGFEAESNLLITTTADEQCEQEYQLEVVKYGQSRRTLKTDYKPHGRYWTIETRNQLGGDFSVDTIDVDYLTLPRGVVKG